MNPHSAKIKDADHPEFPQASPEMKYVIDQVSKIEDARACGTGYYKSLSKVLARLDKTDIILNQLLARLDKTDIILNQLNQTTTDLKKVTDSDVIATCIGTKSDEVLNDLHEQMATTIERLDKNIRDVDSRIILPIWKLWVYGLLTLIVGIGLGMWVSP